MFDNWDSWDIADDEAVNFLFNNLKLQCKILEQSKRIDKIEQEVNKMEKKNIAPKEIQGQYKLNIKDNKITLTDDKGDEYISRCHPDDKFKVGLGVEEAFTKKILKEKEEEKIKVGDIVRVTDSCESYSLYTEWLIKNLKDMPNYLEYLISFDFDNEPDEDEEYEVVCIAPDMYNKKDLLYFIKTKDCFYRCYLMSKDGIEKVKR